MLVQPLGIEPRNAAHWPGKGTPCRVLAHRVFSLDVRYDRVLAEELVPKDGEQTRARRDDDLNHKLRLVRRRACANFIGS